MIWITDAEIGVHLQDRHLNEIIEDTPAILDTAELTAISFVRDALFSRYDADKIFEVAGTERSATVMRWVTTLMVYYIYERIPDRLKPDTVIDNYKEVMRHLKDIETNKRNINLPVKTDPADDTTITNFKWGGEPRRTH